jgi:RND superfamily putative drug exporter
VIGLIIAVIYGLSTDYEVFLVSRMVEARERGMSTAEAIRIGTATTGRIITAAALVLIVVAGAFAFSDLVMMKYLAFGLITALVLDATIIRMFLVPAVMKLLGDDCWWAPRWMKRLQVKIGLGEIHLPDERKRPIVRDPADALVGAGAPVSAARRPAHDPTHPVEGRAMPRVVGRAEYRTPPPPQDPPSAAGTSRMPDAASDSAPGVADAPTTRFSVAKNAVKNAVNTATSAARSNRPPAPPAPDREIESWLGELRGKPGTPAAPTPPPPSAEPTTALPPPEDATTAIPAQREPNDTDEVPPAISAEETRAIPVSRPDQGDSEVATEKLNSRGKKEGDEQRRRGTGGGVSAADLLRREGRL